MIALLSLAACGPAGRDVGGETGSGASAAEAAYRPPPQIIAADRTPTGLVLLVGKADPSTQVRLAAPNGALTQATIDGRGWWRARLPFANGVRLFGLASVADGRTIQAEGYLAIPPNGPIAQLRAGAGARVLAPAGPLRILAIDYDRKGGAVVSGIAQPDAVVSVSADDAPRGRLTADRQGRFSLAFDEPLGPGAHRIGVSNSAERSETDVTVAAPAPLTDAPFRAEREGTAWRIDWLTPGGGVQTTVVFPLREPSA